MKHQITYISIISLLINCNSQEKQTMNDSHKGKPNKLIDATSPYLLQHAYNPVNWYPWGKEALKKAKEEDKPIIVSIGYSSCHWCHVMEHESFENDSIAAIMNENFISIKVDREERPDVDQIYMDAVQTMGISGGWPLNVFLTPDQKPFYGGTYFDPSRWTHILKAIDKDFRANRDSVEKRADQLANALSTSEVIKYKLEDSNTEYNVKNMEPMFFSLAQKFDRRQGGFNRAPKFPMPSNWLFLLRYYHATTDENALEQLKLTLDEIARGGIYDQAGWWFRQIFYRCQVARTSF